MMKQHQIHLMEVVVSDRCRTYSYRVFDSSGDARQFTVEVELELFRTGPLKFQDGPLITSERLLDELARETPSLPANVPLSVSEPDILEYLARHYPPKQRSWNHKSVPAANQ